MPYTTPTHFLNILKSIFYIKITSKKRMWNNFSLILIIEIYRLENACNDSYEIFFIQFTFIRFAHHMASYEWWGIIRLQKLIW